MNRIDWRERFVGLCLKDHTRDQRNRVLSWCGAGLGGLRWEAISGFCKTVPHLNNSTSTFIFTIIFFAYWYLVPATTTTSWLLKYMFSFLYCRFSHWKSYCVSLGIRQSSYVAMWTHPDPYFLQMMVPKRTWNDWILWWPQILIGFWFGWFLCFRNKLSWLVPGVRAVPAIHTVIRAVQVLTMHLSLMMDLGLWAFLWLMKLPNHPENEPNDAAQLKWRHAKTHNDAVSSAVARQSWPQDTPWKCNVSWQLHTGLKSLKLYQRSRTTSTGVNWFLAGLLHLQNCMVT